MRTVWTSIVASALCAPVGTLFAAPLEATQQQGAQPHRLEERQLREVGRLTLDDAESLVGFFFPKLPPRSLDQDKEIAGLPRGSRPELLTWERVYGLALVRAPGGLAHSLEVRDLKPLGEIAARQGLADFTRFRHEFLAGRPGAGGTFRDPAGDYLQLLRRLQVIDNARCDVALRENCLLLYRELIRGESSVLSALEVDLVEASLVGARQRLANATAQFRDRLDELKAALGLGPRALLLPDPQRIAAFREAFDGVHNWHRDPKRKFEMLPQLTARLPELGEVVVEGKPILASIDANPDRLEDVLAAATGVAIKNRGGPEKGAAARATDMQLELTTRRHIRRLLEARRAYDREKRHYELATRLIEQVLEQLVAPPAGGTQTLAQAIGARIATQALLDQLVQLQRAQDDLVTLWASFKAERLAFYRDLGILPYDDWQPFFDDLAARPGRVR
jgi:hypothetical protein